MREWMLPTIGSLILWGLWSFIPKLTTRYLEPSSAIVYEVLGGVLLVAIASLVFQPRLEVHPIGTALAISTGMLGFLGAFFFLTAVSKGPVTLVATISALYPLISVVLAVFLLHETLTLQQSIGVFLAIVSIALIAA